jgi:hypothetical protein
MDLRIVEDYIKAIEYTHFQDFCDRLLLKIYPDDYVPVRAGGRNGDMKNDGYCLMKRVFFQAHATRGESAKTTKSKIENDLRGCLEKWDDVREFIYITNDTPIGEVENHLDSLRKENPAVKIRIWSPKVIVEKMKDLNEMDIEYIIERSIAKGFIINNNNGSKVINQGTVNIQNQNVNY